MPKTYDSLGNPSGFIQRHSYCTSFILKMYIHTSLQKVTHHDTLGKHMRYKMVLKWNPNRLVSYQETIFQEISNRRSSPLLCLEKFCCGVCVCACVFKIYSLIPVCFTSFTVVLELDMQISTGYVDNTNINVVFKRYKR